MNPQGKKGEQAAARYLEEHGYSILEQNYTKRGGELDLVARNETFLVFVEVKTRRENASVSPLESVTNAQRRRLIQTALQYLQSHPTPLQPRFDVIGLTMNGDRVVFVEHIENAFPGGGYF